MSKKAVSKASLIAVPILLIGLFCLNSAQAVEPIEGTWATKANMPTARYSHGSAVVDGKIYVVGGQPGNPGSISSIVEEYDQAADTWTTLANMPTARQGGCATAADGIVYAIGGNGGQFNDVDFATVEAYDPTTNTWTAKADMPSPRTLTRAVSLDGKIYVIGGAYGPSVFILRTVVAYDPATNTWTTKPDMPTARWASAACVVNGKIYVFGGGIQSWFVPNFAATAVVEVYDPVTNAWTHPTDMPRARVMHSAAAVDGKIYIMGGANPANLGPGPPYEFSVVDVYDPAADTWTTAPDLPTPRGHQVAEVVNGKIYVIGGMQGPPIGNFPKFSIVEEFTPVIPTFDLNEDGIVDFGDFAIFALSIYDDSKGDLDAGALADLAEHWLEDLRLVAHWKMDEQDGDIAADSAGANDAALHGDPNWQPTAGRVAGAIDLDGIDDYLSTGFALDPGDGPFSVFAWVKAGAPDQVVISQVGETGRSWLAADSQGNLMTDLRAPAGRLFGPPLFSNSLITGGEWHRIGLLWDGSYRHLYTDGEEVATDIEDQTALVGADGGLYFGAENTLSTTGFFDGMIDDIRLYDQAVLP